METTAELILSTLDSHLTGEARVRLFGGAALALGYGLARFTEDADLLMDDPEFEALVEAGFEDAVTATNAALASRGLYISHVFGPEQQILTPEWREGCRPVARSFEHLRVEVLGPLDLIVSKLARADAQDLADIEHVIRREGLDAAEVRAAVERAIVPSVLADAFRTSRGRLEALLGRLSS